MTDALLQEIVERTIHFEGSVAWMYLDSFGNVTVGAGHRIFNQVEALALPWRWAALTLATEQQAIRDYREILEANAGHIAAFYAPLTTCRLLPEDIREICRADITRCLTTIRTFLPRFDSLPNGVQEAIADIGINVGAHFLPHWPKLYAAIKAGDWAEAAVQSHRAPPVPDERNAEIAKLFRGEIVSP